MPWAGWNSVKSASLLNVPCFFSRTRGRQAEINLQPGKLHVIQVIQCTAFAVGEGIEFYGLERWN